MRFQGSAKMHHGETDYDPITNPGDILPQHILTLPEAPESGSPASALWLALVGVLAETVTVSLYFLIDETDKGADASKYISSSNRWFLFASDIQVDNGILKTVQLGIPPGGVVYARRTLDTIAAGQTRTLVAAWV